MKQLCVLIVSMFVFNAANSAIIEGSGITIKGSSYETFVDTSTDIEWLDIDSFFNQSYNTVVSIIASTGITYASESQVVGLLTTFNNANSVEWDSMWAIAVGAGRNDLIWGRSATAGHWHWKDRGIFRNDNIYAENDYKYADFGHFLIVGEYKGQVPVPAPLALLGLGLIGIALTRNRKS